MTNRQVPEITPAAWAKARLQLQRQRQHKRESIIISRLC
jgi:hypothetical protein